MSYYVVEDAGGGASLRSEILKYKQYGFSTYDDDEFVNLVQYNIQYFKECKVEYNNILTKIVNLNIQLLNISNAKSNLYLCKNNLMISDSMMEEISDNNVKYDYGEYFHPTIERLTSRSNGNSLGFDKTVDDLNDAKNKIEKDLKSLGGELDDYYDKMCYVINFYYFLVYSPFDCILPDENETNERIQEALGVA